MIIVRPIRFTAHMAAHRVLLNALGASLLTDAPGWEVYGLGSGRLALHAADLDGSADAAGAPDSPPSGTTVLAFETDDLSEWMAKASARGLNVQLKAMDRGPVAEVRARRHRFEVDEVDDLNRPADFSPGAGSKVSVLQIWYSPDAQAARAVIEKAGPVPRIAADDGIWADFTCAGGGLVGVHAEEDVAVELAFEFDGDISELSATLSTAGVRHHVIDEKFSRCIRIPDPDLDGHIQINERQRDLYGFSDFSQQQANQPVGQ
ncbi:MAG: hypothetical protein WA880_01715 [Ornithinimicrobium sp.]